MKNKSTKDNERGTVLKIGFRIKLTEELRKK